MIPLCMSVCNHVSVSFALRGMNGVERLQQDSESFGVLLFIRAVFYT